MGSKNLFYSILLFLLLGCTEKASEKIPKYWAGQLHLSEKIKLPVRFELSLNSKDSLLVLINNTERLAYSIKPTSTDSLSVWLEPYNSELVFVASASAVTGVWKNWVKENYKVDFTAIPSIEYDGVKNRMDHKFQLTFGDEESAYPAVLELTNDDDKIGATIKTETGDYRYLFGEQIGDSLWFGCFDGAHAFLFTAQIKADSLVNGIFYSGNHFRDSWSGQIDPHFKLTDPTALTKAISDSGFRFSLKTTNNTTFNENDKSLKNKVVCIQIMGTWCPNCKDETQFLKELRKNYSENDLAILAASFEYEKDTLEALSRIKTYSKAMEMNYPIFYGGSTNKRKVTDVFPDLDRVISYPTLIILDKNGRVAQVHTGFNGPATDEYKEFKKSTYQLIDSLALPLDQ